MVMRFFSFVLTFALLTSVAHAETAKGLKAAFDELNYSLSVEWDQKDPAFLNARSEEFARQMIDSGKTNQEILGVLLKEIQNEKLKTDLETTFTLMSLNLMSQAEALEQFKQIMQKNYRTGASWNGGSVLFGMVLMVAIIAVVGIVYKEQLKEEGEKCYMAWKCNDYCGLTGCQQVCGEECI